jgi:hypothetical protein
MTFSVQNFHLGIKDGRPVIAQEVSGHQLVVSIAEDALRINHPQILAFFIYQI